MKNFEAVRFEHGGVGVCEEQERTLEGRRLGVGGSFCEVEERRAVVGGKDHERGAGE